MKSISAQQVIDYLGMKPLPGEGGFYIETYRAAELTGQRNICTAIYYLLTANTFSRFHRLKSDEIWHFYSGDSVELVLLHPDATSTINILGHNLLDNEVCQVVIPGQTWQGARLEPGRSWALMGCTVAPGFEFADCELAEKASLIQKYPAMQPWIECLT